MGEHRDPNRHGFTEQEVTELRRVVERALRNESLGVRPGQRTVSEVWESLEEVSWQVFLEFRRCCGRPATFAELIPAAKAWAKFRPDPENREEEPTTLARRALNSAISAPLEMGEGLRKAACLSARKVLGDRPEDIDDAASLAWEGWQRGFRPEGGSKATSFMWAIACWRAIDVARRNVRRAGHLKLMDPHTESWARATEQLLEDYEANPSDPDVNRRIRQIVRDGGMDPEILSEHCDADQHEIAERLDISYGAYRGRLRTLKGRLRGFR